MSLDGINSIVDFSFYPVGGFPTSSKPTPQCPPTGDDKNCSMDALEACLFQQYCFAGKCSSMVQKQLIDFLYCFEGVNGNDKSLQTANECAKKVNIDFRRTQTCYKNPITRQKAWEQSLAAALKTGLLRNQKCLPWVALNGKIISNPANATCGHRGQWSANLVRA